MDMSYLQRQIDKSLELHDRGFQDPETTVLDIVHGIVGEAVGYEVIGEAVEVEQVLSAISYFLEVAPKEVVRAGAERMIRLRNDTDFMVAPLSWGPHDLTNEEKESIILKRRTLYHEIHQVLKQESEGTTKS